MLSCIKNSFKLTNKYIILATPLIFFSLLSSLYILFSIGGNLISLVIAFILSALMLAAFMAGWFYMIKLCITDIEREEPNTLIKEFTSGVGEYFLPMLGVIFNILVLSALIMWGAYFTGMKFIGDVGIQVSALEGVFESVETMKQFLNSLTPEQLFKLNAWNVLLFVSMGIEYLLVLFYLPAIFFKTKNPFKGFWFNLKDLFSRKLFKNIFFYILLSISYMILSFVTTIFGMNPITHFIFTLINFYYLVFIAVLLFDYYYSNFIKIGSNFDETV